MRRVVKTPSTQASTTLSSTFHRSPRSSSSSSSPSSSYTSSYTSTKLVVLLLLPLLLLRSGLLPFQAVRTRHLISLLHIDSAGEAHHDDRTATDKMKGGDGGGAVDGGRRDASVEFDDLGSWRSRHLHNTCPITKKRKNKNERTKQQQNNIITTLAMTNHTFLISIFCVSHPFQ